MQKKPFKLLLVVLIIAITTINVQGYSASTSGETIISMKANDILFKEITCANLKSFTPSLLAAAAGALWYEYYSKNTREHNENATVVVSSPTSSKESENVQMNKLN